MLAKRGAGGYCVGFVSVKKNVIVTVIQGAGDE
jgi:hypothetical protein